MEVRQMQSMLEWAAKHITGVIKKKTHIDIFSVSKTAEELTHINCLWECKLGHHFGYISTLFIKNFLQ